jgi:D-serine dehydratase
MPMNREPMIEPGFKGYPHDAPARRPGELAALGWNMLAGDLPLPVALIRRSALEHNLAWMQRFARERGVDLAPHGKTTMSPQLFRRQLEAGAWGLTVANATQLAVAVAAGARRVLVANQVLAAADLRRIASLKALHDGLRVVFLLDSGAQLDLIEAWAAAQAGAAPFDVLLELGVAGGRTGCRAHDDAMALARRVRAGNATRLVGVECYEGLWATGRSDDDAAFAAALMDRVEALARQCAAERLFDTDEVLLSAGGSAIFDLVAGRLAPALGRPVRGLLRSGCYVTHDHGHYGRMLALVAGRCGCADTPRPALEVWAQVQSCPEPGLAIVAAGRRDLSFDMGLPVPFARAALSATTPSAVSPSWQVIGLNDQHAYLRWDAAHAALAPVVGERVGLGISHPCTTFDKWRWMPVVDDDYRVVDAITTAF